MLILVIVYLFLFAVLLLRRGKLSVNAYGLKSARGIGNFFKSIVGAYPPGQLETSDITKPVLSLWKKVLLWISAIVLVVYAIAALVVVVAYTRQVYSLFNLYYSQYMIGHSGSTALLGAMTTYPLYSPETGGDPFGIAFDGTNMWVANRYGGVTKITPSGATTTYPLYSLGFLATRAISLLTAPICGSPIMTIIVLLK